MSGPRVLVVTSVSSPSAVVVPLIAALDAAGADVRALDVGRLGARAGGAAQRVIKVIAGELSGRRLEHELDERPPEVVVALDPASVAALVDLRPRRPPFAIAALVGELDPAADWADAAADRFLAIDDRAAAALDGHGVSGDRIVTVGPLAPAAFAAAALEARDALRTRFKIRPGDPVAVVEVAGLGYEGAGQLALQLSLTARATWLFSAGDDAEAAAALRARVPTLAMRAKLFGATADVPLYFRAADVVVARPRLATAMAALEVGAGMIALGEGAEESRAIAAALEARGVGRRAEGIALVGAALESLTAKKPPAPLAGIDGVATAVDALLLMARDRDAIAAEAAAADARARGAERAAAGEGDGAASAGSGRRSGAAAGELEDLGGEEPEPAAPRSSSAGRAPAGGGASGARAAAPSVDDLLSDLKRQGGAGTPRPAAEPRPSSPRGGGVDDELEALKRKMAGATGPKKKGPS